MWTAPARLRLSAMEPPCLACRCRCGMSAVSAGERRWSAAGLRRCHPALDLIATSPLRRALQTAEIVAAAYAPLTVAECEALVPQAHPEELLDWLRGQQGDSVAVVGHEPGLGIWTSWALTGDTI